MSFLRNKTSRFFLFSLLLFPSLPSLKGASHLPKSILNQSHEFKVMKNVSLHQVESKMTPITLHTLERSWIPQRPLGLEQLGHTKCPHRQNSQELPATMLPTSKGDHPRPTLPEVARLSPWLIISKAIPEDTEQVPKRASLPRNLWHSPLGNYIIKTQKAQNFLLAKSRKQMQRWGLG